MRLIVDTHVHVYPCYDIRQILDTLRANLTVLDGKAVCMACLAERWDCHFFDDFGRRFAEILGSTVQVNCLGNVILLQESGYPDLYIFAGRQIISKERIEILSLTLNKNIPDGLPAKEIIDRILHEEGLPVVSWAPGKWFFRRKKVVAGLLETFQPGTLLVGDTTLRPYGWLQPLLMKKAVRRGFAVVGGSDPLPFAGEEKVVGKYATLLEADVQLDDPVSAIREILRRPGLHPALVGKRGQPLATFRRLVKNAQSKKQER